MTSKNNEPNNALPLNLDEVLSNNFRSRNQALESMKIETGTFPEKAPATPPQRKNNDKKDKPRDGGYGIA